MIIILTCKNHVFGEQMQNIYMHLYWSEWVCMGKPLPYSFLSVHWGQAEAVSPEASHQNLRASIHAEIYSQIQLSCGRPLASSHMLVQLADHHRFTSNFTFFFFFFSPPLGEKGLPSQSFEIPKLRLWSVMLMPSQLEAVLQKALPRLSYPLGSQCGTSLVEPKPHLRRAVFYALACHPVAFVRSSLLSLRTSSSHQEH